MAGAPEEYSYRSDVVDNETGKREIKGLDPHARISGRRKFLIDRLYGTDQEYWRTFVNTIRGAQKAFFLSTYFPDLTISKDFTETSSTLNIDQDTYGASYGKFGTWKQIAVEYIDGTFSYHSVTTTGKDVDGFPIITLSPAMPAGRTRQDIRMVSFLTKVRSEDKIDLKHYETESEITLTITTVDE
jgi:hypothetical protein